MLHELDDFLCEIQPEELEEPMLMPEDIQDDNPIDSDFEDNWEEPYFLKELEE